MRLLLIPVLILVSIPVLILVPTVAKATTILQVAPALNYWVDSANGSDSNPPGLPYATLTQLQTADAANPRQVWNLQRGSTWYTPLIPTRNGTTIQQYGTGANYPLIDGGYAIPASAWSVSSGNCYVATVSVNLLPTKTWVNVWVNNVALANWVTSAANCASTSNSYYTSAHLGSGLTSISLYVNLGGTNPGSQSDGYIVVSNLVSGLSTGASAQYADRVLGIWTRRQTGENGSALIGSGSYVNGLLATDGSKHNILVAGNVTMYNTEAHNAYEYGTTNGMIQGSGISGFFYCNGCYAHNDALVTTSQGFDEDPPSGGGAWTSCSWINSQTAYTDGAFTGANCATVTYANDTVTNTQGGYGFGLLNTSGSLTNSSFSSGSSSGGRGVTISSASSPSITLSGLTINDPYTQYGIYSTSPGFTLSLTSSSILCQFANCNDIYLPPTATGVSLTSTGNAFQALGYIYYFQPTLSSLTSNNNTFYMPINRTAAFLYNNTSYSLSGYQTASGQDGSSAPESTSIIYDFGSYSSGATPTTVTDSGNLGIYPLTRNAFTFNGVAAAFSGSAQNGTAARVTLGNNNTMWAIFNPSVVSCGSLCVIMGQVNANQLQISANKEVALYNGNGVTLTNSTNLTANNWYFVAVACNSTGGGNLYIGQSGTVTNVGSSAMACVASTTWPGPITIGSQSNNASYLTGQIAQAGMYNTTLSASQLQTLLNNWTSIDSGRGITIH